MIVCEPVTIASIEIFPLDVSLHDPFPIASDLTKVGATHNVLVTMTSADGIVGLGEAAPFKGISGDTQEDLLRDLHDTDCFLGGPWMADRFASTATHRLRYPSARAGMNMAFLDIAAKQRGIPLWRLLNPRAEPKPMQTDITIPLVGPSVAERFAQKYLARGFSRIKIKVGDDFNVAFERVEAVYDVFKRAGKEVEILIDANEGFSLKEAIEFLRLLDDNRIRPKIFEQPIPRRDIFGLRRLHEEAKKMGVLLIADESVYHATKARYLAEEELVDGFNLKLAKHGNLQEAIAIAEVARQHGLYLMVGGMVETRLGMTAMLHLALVLGNVGWCDLDTPLLLDDRHFAGGIVYRVPEMTLPQGLGIGVDMVLPTEFESVSAP